MNVPVILTLLAVVVCICWILLPFAIIGIKPILRELIEAQRETTEQQRAIIEQLYFQNQLLNARLPALRQPDKGHISAPV